MKCPSCGTTTSDIIDVAIIMSNREKYFCNECGKQLVTKCECGSQLFTSQKFCPHCGKANPIAK
jgi:transposase-like protein